MTRPRGPNLETHTGYSDPWRGLALAVIERAVRDVRRYCAEPQRRTWHDYCGSSKACAETALCFLQSRWADDLACACDLPGPSWRKLREELRDKVCKKAV
jgi:hypothetical protein